MRAQGYPSSGVYNILSTRPIALMSVHAPHAPSSTRTIFARALPLFM